MPKRHNAPKTKRSDDGSMNKKRSHAAPLRCRAEELIPLSPPKLKNFRQPQSEIGGNLE